MTNTLKAKHEHAVRKAMRFIKSKDKKLGKVIDQWGMLPYYRPKPLFETLVRTIVGQQLSGKVARTIFKRIRALCEGKTVTIERIRKLSDAKLRKAGMSNAKVKSVRDLVKHVDSGKLSLRKLPHMSDDDVAAAIVQVWGLGPWSAQMLLMFTLGRLDLFPSGDLGIKYAMRDLYGLDPDKSDLDKFAKRWKPYRTVASIYLWKSLDNKPEV